MTMGLPTPSQIGLIVSLMVLGAFTSVFFVGYLAGLSGPLPSFPPHADVPKDTIGRRRSIILGCLVFFVGGSLQTSAQHLGSMLAGRFVAGVGIGMLTMLAPLYQSEIAHPSVRGRLTSLQQFFLGVSAAPLCTRPRGTDVGGADRRARRELHRLRLLQ
jgi:MFS family permease